MSKQQRTIIRRRHAKYYKNQFMKWLRKNNVIRQKTQDVLSKLSKQQQNSYKIPTLTQQQFSEYISSLNINNQPPSPVLINLSKRLKFTYPQKVIIRLARKDNNTKVSDNNNVQQQQQNVDVITCTKSGQQDDVIFLEVDKEQFINNNNNNNNNKYQQQKQKFSISIPQMQLPPQSYQQPQLVKSYFRHYNSNKNNNQNSKQLYSVNLWHYKTHTVTKLHYDAHDNFLFQISGVKHVVLKETNSINSLGDDHRNEYVRCLNVFGINSNHAVIAQQQNKSNIKSNPVSQNKKYNVTIQQSQCLFIPRGWFHQIQSFVDNQSNNMAINFWGNTIPAYSITDQQLQINLKQLIFRMSDNLCMRNVKGWVNSDDEIQQRVKQQYRKAYFYQYLNTLSQKVIEQ